MCIGMLYSFFLAFEQSGQVLLDELDYSVRSSRHLKTLRQGESLQLRAHDLLGFSVDALGLFWCPHGCSELSILSVFCCFVMAEFSSTHQNVWLLSDNDFADLFLVCILGQPVSTTSCSLMTYCLRFRRG